MTYGTSPDSPQTSTHTSRPRLAAVNQPSELTSLLNSANRGTALLTSAALQETDLSAPPVGLDLPAEDASSFRRTRLLPLDLVKGILLCFQAIEHAGVFVGSWSLGQQETWYNKRSAFPHPLSYALRFMTHPCPPGFHIFFAVGTVFYIQSRLCLGWSRKKLAVHFLYRGLALVVINELLVSDFIIRGDGASVIVSLPLWTMGINLMLSSWLFLSLAGLERFVASFFVSPEAPVDQSRRRSFRFTTTAKKAERIAHFAVDMFLLMGALLMQLLIILVTPDPGTPARARKTAFWFFLVPSPAERKEAYWQLMSLYSPLGWLSFSIVGLLYGRWLARKPRNNVTTAGAHLTVFVLMLGIFAMTRAFRFGNLSEHLLPSSAYGQGKSPYLTSGRAFFYVVKYSPDIAYTTLSLCLISLLLFTANIIPTKLAEALPFATFGRTPIFFYVAHTLLFRFVSGFVLAYFGLPTRLHFTQSLLCYLLVLGILWSACKAFVKWKDNKRPDSVWRFL